MKIKINMESAFKVPEIVLFDTPVPKETKSYKPVSHRHVAETTLEAIHSAGFKLDKTNYSSAADGNIANARYTISDVADSEMQLEIGWQNSYNKQLTLKFAIGTRIFICQNGCVSGNMGSFKRKHTGDVIDFAPLAIIEAIKRSGDTFTEIQKQRDLMKEIEMTKKTQAEIIGRMYIEQELIKSNQLSIIRDELKKPTFDYGCKDSLWELYNYTTFAMRDSHPGGWIDSHIKLHQFFTGIDSLSIPLKIIEPVIVVPSLADPNQTNILDEIAMVEEEQSQAH